MSGLAYLRQAYRLKERPRTGWRLRGVQDGESVADHSWGTALLCLLYADDAGVDRAAALEIALVHDLAEAEIGDLPSPDAPKADPDARERKARLEAQAMAALGSSSEGASGARVSERWHAYEDRSGPEAAFVRDMNLVDMALQALVYLEDGRSSREALDEFFRSAETRVSTALGRALVAEIVAAAPSRPDPRAGS